MYTNFFYIQREVIYRLLHVRAHVGGLVVCVQACMCVCVGVTSQCHHFILTKTFIVRPSLHHPVHELHSTAGVSWIWTQAIFPRNLERAGLGREGRAWKSFNTNTEKPGRKSTVFHLEFVHLTCFVRPAESRSCLHTSTSWFNSSKNNFLSPDKQLPIQLTFN